MTKLEALKEYGQQVRLLDQVGDMYGQKRARLRKQFALHTPEYQAAFDALEIEQQAAQHAAGVQFDAWKAEHAEIMALVWG